MAKLITRSIPKTIVKGIRDTTSKVTIHYSWTGTYRNCVMYKTKICMFGLSTSINASMMGLGKDGATKSDEFSEITLLNQFHAQKAILKFPKSAM